MLKDDIKKVLGVELPISGGYGMYPEDTVIIHALPGFNLSEVEADIQKYLLEKFCKTYRLINCEILKVQDRVLKRYFYNCDYKDCKPQNVELTYIYFDITECWEEPGEL